MSGASLDLQQLLQLIYLDVYEGITPFVQYTRGEQGLEISSVKIRAGNIPFDSEGKVAVNDAMLKDPLLAADDVWQVEMVFGEALPESSEGMYSLTATELFSSGAKNHCTLFHPLPVSFLQNAGEKTVQWLLSAGISEIGQLCTMSDETLRKLNREHSKANLVELRTKARLLETTIPKIPVPNPTKESLYALSHLTAPELMARFPAGTLDGKACRSLLNYLGLITTCLDDKYLKKRGLMFLREGSL